MKIPGGIEAIAFEGLYRGVAGAATSSADGRLRVDVTEHRDPSPTDERTRELEREYRAVVDEILEVRDADPRIQAFLRSITEPGVRSVSPQDRTFTLRSMRATMTSTCLSSISTRWLR